MKTAVLYKQSPGKPRLSGGEYVKLMDGKKKVINAAYVALDNGALVVMDKAPPSLSVERKQNDQDFVVKDIYASGMWDSVETV